MREDHDRSPAEQRFGRRVSSLVGCTLRRTGAPAGGPGREPQPASHRPLRGRNSPLEQSAAGCSSTSRRSRHADPHRRDDGKSRISCPKNRDPITAEWPTKMAHEDSHIARDCERLREHLRMPLQEVALENGTWVICDRFTDASFAYQGFGRELGFEKVNELKKLIQKDFEPDLTILLDAPLEVITSRRKLNPNDRFESEDRKFFERVRNGYLELARIFKERVKVIDASNDLKDVQDQIRILVNEMVRAES